MAKKKSDNGLSKARVLVDCEAGKCNTIVEADADQIAVWVAKKLVDDSPEAVAAVEDAE